MTSRFFTACVMLASLALPVMPAQAQQPTPPQGLAALTNALPTLPVTPTGPRIKFATNEYDFGRLQSGNSVKFSYVFTNIGDQLLEVTGVQPQCGCTTAGDWSRKVEPGQTGTIPIQYNSGHSPAMPILKTITVTSTDSTQSPLVLRLKGTIWNPIEITPSPAALTVLPDSDTGSTTLTINNNMETPVDVFEPQSSSPILKMSLTTNVPGKQFYLTVSVTPGSAPSSMPCSINLKTTATNIPTINAVLYLNVAALIATAPSQINLPQAPLDKSLTASVSIQNAGTNLLALTNSSINASNVDIQVREMQPGRLFNVLVAFPQGFEIPHGQKVELVFKTGLSKAPEVRIPVFQVPRPPTVRVNPVPPPAAAPSTPPIALPKPPMPGASQAKH
jgi:hypothetical protein